MWLLAVKRELHELVQGLHAADHKNIATGLQWCVCLLIHTPRPVCIQIIAINRTLLLCCCTGRHAPRTPARKRLLSDANSNVLVSIPPAVVLVQMDHLIEAPANLISRAVPVLLFGCKVASLSALLELVQALLQLLLQAELSTGGHSIQDSCECAQRKAREAMPGQGQATVACVGHTKLAMLH